MTHVPPHHAAKIDWLIGEMRSHDGLAPLDIDRFWADQEVAAADPFGKNIPQAHMGIGMEYECVFHELGVAEDFWRLESDLTWRAELAKAYNDRAEKIVGRRLLNDRPHDPALVYPTVKGLHDLFEGKNFWHDRSWWLQQSVHTPDELSALLDRVERRLDGDLRAFLLPANWEAQKARLTARGVTPPLYRHQRGPITFAMSIYGVENVIFLILDQPDLAARLRDLILRGICAIKDLTNAEAGYTAATAPRGFGFADDNCVMLTPAMYEFFGYPILKAVFDRYAPDPSDRRGQHSDSAMGHLLPILGRLNFSDVNFGPTLTVSEIRQHCPAAVIQGQLAPFTFSRNQEEQIVAEFLRDFGQARAHRGLSFCTAGSVNNGSRLAGLRLIMSAIQHFGRYDS